MTNLWVNALGDTPAYPIISHESSLKVEVFNAKLTKKENFAGKFAFLVNLKQFSTVSRGDSCEIIPPEVMEGERPA